MIAAVSNKNIFHMLNLYINGVKAANVPNSMVVALDDETGQSVSQGYASTLHRLTQSSSPNAGHRLIGSLSQSVLRSP